MAYNFPEQKTIFSNKPFSSGNLTRIFEEIFRLPRPFTGFLRIGVENGPLYFLFFLQSDPYAAGKFDGKKPLSITITDFFAEIFACQPTQLNVSLCETDPVLLKCMLILLQEDPTIKAPVSMLDLEQITGQVVEEQGDALVVLQKEGTFNFFFIKNGLVARPYFADRGSSPPGDLSPMESMLLYAFERHASPVIAHVYRDISTQQSNDVEQIDRDRLLALSRNVSALAVSPPPVAPPPATPDPSTVVVEIISGADNGKRFTVPLPCSVGRKGCDIVLNDGLMSRRHALFSLLGGKIGIVDQGSTNGTQVNGAEVKQAVLSPTDIITIGETQIKIVS
ncbi:MAG: FHA domain-containing protein [Desulfuromonadales bacterium]|nr:FHA domain-containing protein [Desulfuromonadales bacterium]